MSKDPKIKRYGRRVPLDPEIRADHAAGGRLLDIAQRYGVHAQTLYQHWMRLGLSGAGRLNGMDALNVSRGRPDVPDADRPVPVIAPCTDRLSVADLALAVRLASEVGLPPRVAVAWVRVDIAEAAERPTANGRPQ